MRARPGRTSPTSPIFPPRITFNTIEAGHDVNTAFVAARMGGGRGQTSPAGENTDVPLIWRTTDAGKTWTSIVNGLPRDERTGSWINVCGSIPGSRAPPRARVRLRPDERAVDRRSPRVRRALRSVRVGGDHPRARRDDHQRRADVVAGAVAGARHRRARADLARDPGVVGAARRRISRASSRRARRSRWCRAGACPSTRTSRAACRRTRRPAPATS